MSVYIGYTKLVAGRKDTELGEVELGNHFQQKRILVMYFSMGNNTRTVAEIIRNKTGADIYEVTTSRKYSYLSAFFSKFTSNNPIEETTSVDFASYDLIFIGSPVWFYSVSIPIMSLLKKSDFAGRKVVPFATHRGGLGNFHRFFKDNIRNAQVLDGIEFYKVLKTDK
ncbi:MAG: hypothetical protein LBP39_03360, partial [Rickettsiales bacterium]|nr:hypothetical protein [Rickettsiales bacterium]